MAVVLKINPQNASVSESRNIAFEIDSLSVEKEYRLSIENATHGTFCQILSSKQGTIHEQYIVVKGVSTVSGTINLKIDESNESSVVTLFANIEESLGKKWDLTDISAAIFQINYYVTDKTTAKVSVSPVFAGPGDTATVKVESDPLSTLYVFVNGKKFAVKTNHKGSGSLSFRALDILAGSAVHSTSLQKFPISFSRSDDNFQSIYQSGSFIHYVPSQMKTLQAVHADFEPPSCVIFDKNPGPGLTMKTVDDLCFKGSVAGDLSVFEGSDTYVNSRVGFCGPLNTGNVEPLNAAGTCRIYNSSSSTIVPNGSGLIAFSSAYDSSVDTSASADACNADAGKVNLASRIYIAHVPSSLKFRGNPVRDGTILAPPKFYHTVFFNDVQSGDKLSVEFRFQDGTFVDIQFSGKSTNTHTATDFAALVRTNVHLQEHDVKVIRRDTAVDVYSNNRFTVVTRVLLNGTSDIQACLNTNKSLMILVDQRARGDEGSTIVFLDSQLGSQSYAIDGRDDRVFSISMPLGVNNDRGPTITENIYCQKFVIVDQSRTPSSEGLSNLSPLPYIKDASDREIPAVYPSITASKEMTDGSFYVYVVCQAPISNGSYQLFFTSLRLGDLQASYGGWVQLTFDGENKNPVIRCDGMGNVHIVWESDRTGSTQIYYGVLGPGANIIVNQVAVSCFEKHADSPITSSWFESPYITKYNDDLFNIGWDRGLFGAGAASRYLVLGSNQRLVCQGNPSKDGSMYVVRSNSSPEDSSAAIPSFFTELSYQTSFYLSVLGLADRVLDDNGVDAKFSDWKSQFTPSDDGAYTRNLNRFMLDNIGRYFDSSIPICGSFKLPDFFTGSDLITGGTNAVGYPNTYGHNSYHALTGVDIATSAHTSNLRHYMLLLMPEKVRFKAVNTESFTEFCLRNNQDPSACAGYEHIVENVYYTGRYKLGIVISTVNNDNPDVSNKRHVIFRQFGDYVTFDSPRLITVSSHYTKASSEYVEQMVYHNKPAHEQDYRFHGDIVVGVDSKIQFTQSFLADFSDQYRYIDTVVGFMNGGMFITNESLPYNGNMYENADITLLFDRPRFTSPTLVYDKSMLYLSPEDRRTEQLTVVRSSSGSLLSNGSFEITSASRNGHADLPDGSDILTDWSPLGGVRLWYSTNDQGLVPRYGDRLAELFVGGGLTHAAMDLVIGKQYLLKVTVAFNQNAVRAYGTFEWGFVAELDAASIDDLVTSSDTTNTEWKTYSKIFTAASSSAQFSIQNNSSFGVDSPMNGHGNQYGVLVDLVEVVPVEDLTDELSSNSASFDAGLAESSYRLSLNVTKSMSQIPITFSKPNQERNPDLWVDIFDKPHIAWQTNRFGNWDIAYSGSRDRLSPFRFDVRITDTDSSSIEPSVSADSKGRRLIAWQDNRNGLYQIYCATSSEADELWINRCKFDEADSYIYTTDHQDPYHVDPYAMNVDNLYCQVLFEFVPSVSSTYHFEVDFYSDQARTNLVKRIYSSDSIVGWRVNDIQIDSSGISLTAGETAVVTYSVCKEDGLTDRVLYALVKATDTSTGNVSPADASDAFAFYCSDPQSARCALSFKYQNNAGEPENVHFRATFFADPERKLVILSAFTMISSDGWLIGPTSFDTSGEPVENGETVRVAFDPDILPHALYNSQNTVNGESLQSLLCGVPYYVTVESYVDGVFAEVYRTTLICSCTNTASSIWRENKDDGKWNCSAQSLEDMRVSMSSGDSLRPNVSSTESGLFYIVWEDNRYLKTSDGLTKASDYFFGIYDAEAGNLHSSGQGDYDRRITYYSDAGNKILYDSSIFVDQFQNLNTAFHDGFTMYSRACSVGCIFESVIQDEAKKACSFTDSTDSEFYVVGTAPERGIEQYMKIRIREPFVVYSTYLDLTSAVPVVNDCFLEMDIIGVPGSFAIRLRNDLDESWTEWLRIGPPLPLQSGQDANGTEVQESNFFAARFIGKDRFVVPWVASPGNGLKKVCCEILTFFGKTQQFCVDFMAVYKELEYTVDFFFDAAGTFPVPKYKGMPVISTKKTTPVVSEDNLTSIVSPVETVSTIYVRITFKEPEKLQLIERMRTLTRFFYLQGLTMSVYQQGLNDQLNLPLTMVSNGVYAGSFAVEEEDTIFNKDGLAAVIVNIPGSCKPVTPSQVADRINKLLVTDSLEQSYTIFNDMTVFREKYEGDDTKNSFGQPTYHKTAVFGSGKTGDFTWGGGGSVIVEPTSGTGSGTGESTGGSSTGGTSSGGSTGGTSTGGSSTGGTGESGTGDMRDTSGVVS